MTEALTRPPGDPEALYAAAARFGQLAADASRTKGGVLQGVETALQTWESPRATMFAQATGDISKRLDATASQLGIANRVISQYAGALAAAQAAIDQYSREHATVQQELRQSGQAGGDGQRQDMATQHLSQRQGQIEQRAAAVQGDLRTAATRAAAALDAATEVRLKGAGGMSPDAILRYVTAAWNGIHQVYRTFKEWTDPSLGLMSLGQGFGQTGAALDALNNWRYAYDAELLLRQTRNLEEAKAIAVATIHGADATGPCGRGCKRRRWCRASPTTPSERPRPPRRPGRRFWTRSGSPPNSPRCARSSAWSAAPTTWSTPSTTAGAAPATGSWAASRSSRAARGIALPSEVAADGGVTLALPDDVHAALAMRRAASVIVVAHQRVETGMQARVLYGQGPLLVLEEHVSGGGLHTFSVAPLEEALAGLVALVDPRDSAGDADGPKRALTLSEVAAGRDGLGELGDTRCVTVLGRVVLGERGEPVEERVSVYALKDRVEIADPRERDAQTILEVGAVSKVTLRARLRSLLAVGAP